MKTHAEFLEELKKEAKFYIEREDAYEYFYVHCQKEILNKIEQFEAQLSGDKGNNNG